MESCNCNEKRQLEVAEEARTIKEETDQSVSNQESALEDAKTSKQSLIKSFQRKC